MTQRTRKYHLTYTPEGDGNFEACLRMPVEDLADFLAYVARTTHPYESDALDDDEWKALEQIVERLRVAAEEAGE